MKKENDESNHNHNSHDHGGYSVDHTTIIYLMDKKGNYITHLNPDTTNTGAIKKINGKRCRLKLINENPLITLR